MSDSGDAAVDKMKAKLDELNADLDRWEAKADQAKAEGRGPRGIRRAGGGPAPEAGRTGAEAHRREGGDQWCLGRDGAGL